MGYTLKYETDLFESEQDFDSYDDAVTNLARAIQKNRKFKIIYCEITENSKSGIPSSDEVVLINYKGTWLTPQQWIMTPTPMEPLAAEDAVIKYDNDPNFIRFIQKGVTKVNHKNKKRLVVLDESKITNDVNKLSVSDLIIDDIILLSVEEVDQIPKEYIKFYSRWWTESPGITSESIVLVSFDGSAYHSIDIKNNSTSVRPVLVVLNLNYFNLPIYSKVQLDNGTKWLVISDNMLLCNDKSFGEHKFDENSNDYETSEIRQYIHNQAKELGFNIGGVTNINHKNKKKLIVLEENKMHFNHKHLNEAEDDYIKIGNRIYPKDASDFGYDDPEKVSRNTRIKYDNEKAAEAEAKKIADLKVQAQSLYNEIKNGSNPDGENNIENWFEVLVPDSGKAQTVAGELIRAMMRLLYRDYNDGDKFMFGYGLETCASDAEYLMDSVPEISQLIKHMVEDGESYAMGHRDEIYTQNLEEISTKLLEYLNNHLELLSTPNNIDSREYEAEYILENEPKFDMELTIPDEVMAHIDAGNISQHNVCDEVESWLYNDNIFNGVEVGRGYSNCIYINNLNYDALRELERWENDDSIWEDYIEALNEEFGDPSEDEDDDFTEAFKNYAKHNYIK